MEAWWRLGVPDCASEGCKAKPSGCLLREGPSCPLRSQPRNVFSIPGLLKKLVGWLLGLRVQTKLRRDALVEKGKTAGRAALKEVVEQNAKPVSCHIQNLNSPSADGKDWFGFYDYDSVMQAINITAPKDQVVMGSKEGAPKRHRLHSLLD
jgi:hypothetical protein